jgi:hypothetical protein
MSFLVVVIVISWVVGGGMIAGADVQHPRDDAEFAM